MAIMEVLLGRRLDSDWYPDGFTDCLYSRASRPGPTFLASYWSILSGLTPFLLVRSVRSVFTLENYLISISIFHVKVVNAIIMSPQNAESTVKFIFFRPLKKKSFINA